MRIARHEEWLRKAAQTWDERAGWWDEMSSANALSQDRLAELDRWQTALGIGPGSRVLDAGCGSGQFAIAWSRRGCLVTGIDVSDEMLARARVNAAAAEVDIAFLSSPLAPLALPGASYDAIFCRTVLHLVPAPVAALSEFRRVLRPSGRLWVSVPGALSPIYANVWRRHMSDSLRPINDMVPWELEMLLEECGWRVVEQWGDWSGQDLTDANGAAAIARESSSVRLHQATATTWGFVAD